MWPSLCSFTFIVEYFNGIFSTTMLASATFTSGMILVSVDAALNMYVANLAAGWYVGGAAARLWR